MQRAASYAERPQAQRRVELAWRLHGEGKAVAGSSRRDSGARSLQRLVRRCGIGMKNYHPRIVRPLKVNLSPSKE